MKSLLLAVKIGVLVCGALAAQAQAPVDADAQQLAQTIGPDRLPDPAARNVLTLSQSGASNTATLNQANSDGRANEAYMVQAGAANALSLDQLGSANRATYAQSGTGNQTTLSQRGTANQLAGSLQGSQNELLLRQQGSGNQLSSTVAADGRRYEVSQIGNNNEFTQRESAGSTARQGYNVVQRGNNMRLTIEQGRVLP